MLADFHLHSHHSDGRLDPVSLIDVVADAGVQIAALTDHDTTAGCSEAARRAGERGIKFIFGIEMTTYAHGRVIHMLGLRVDDSNAGLQATNDAAIETWDANQRRWVESLARDGADVQFDRDFSDHPVRLPVLIERLCRRGVANGDPVYCHARFRSFFAALPSDAYEQLATPSQASAIIRDAGGVALVAHPDRLRDARLLDGLLNDCDGLEAMYLGYDDRQREALRALAEKRRKLYSCGSDYHGYFSADYRPPNWETPPELLRRLGLM